MACSLTIKPNVMNEKVLEELKQFIINQRWEYKIPLLRETKLQEDLSIYGDDAVEFMIAYGKHFNVDVSKFMAAEYFSDEGGVKLPVAVKKLFKNGGASKKVLTIGHLEKGILAGRLDEEVIKS